MATYDVALVMVIYDVVQVTETYDATLVMVIYDAI